MAIETISRPFVGSPQQPNRARRLATRLYDAIRRRQGAAVTTNLPTASAVTVAADVKACPVTVVCVSDTHNTTPAPLPPGDILLHAGDLSQFGTFAEIQSQLTWLATQPHQHKVVIAGNHDLLLDSAFVAAHPDRELDRHDGKRRSDLDWGGVRYLEHNSLDLEVEGKGRTIRVFGSPETPRCGNWAFQYGQEEGSRNGWHGAVQDGTDLVLVHGPPEAHLDDGGKGCRQLLDEIWRTRPRVVVCGHIHAGRGVEWLPFDRAQSWYENAVSGRGQWISVASLAMWIFWLVVIDVLKFAKGRQQTKGTLCVNAAVVGGPKDSEPRDAIVVAI